MKSELIDMEAILKHETESAWLLDTGDEKPVWIPKSMAEFDGETLTLPEWIATEKGLI
tara:strand:- start:2474 stop:2647 length:174 start_codon:yes stop_codon:yes gene_type:complete